MSSSDQLVQEMIGEIEKSHTAQKYQAIADILHYKVGMSGEEIFGDPSGSSDKYLDSPVQYHIPDDYVLLSIGKLEEIRNPVSADWRKIKKVNSQENIKKLVNWANQEALSKSFLRILEKFKLEPKSKEAVEVFGILKNMYNLDAPDDVLKENVRKLKKILITERLRKNFAKLGHDISEQQGRHISGIIDIYLEKIESSPDKREEFLATAITDLKKILNEKISEDKLKKILTKFPILRKIEDPKQVRERVKDETIGEVHANFAKEIELLTHVERVEFHGDEVLYRGIPLAAIPEADIFAGFEKIHRAKSEAGSIAAHQIKTAWNRIFHPKVMGIASNATATSSNPLIAIDYAFDKNKRGSWSEERVGWVFEIRPKKGQTAVALVNYEERGEKYSEFDFSQVDPNEVFAVHKITRRSDRTIVVDKSIVNPYYKKRDSEREGEKSPDEGIFFNPGTTIEEVRDPSSWEDQIFVKKASSGDAMGVAGTVFSAPKKQIGPDRRAYRHIQGKSPQEGEQLTQEQVRTRRKEKQDQGTDKSYQERLKATGFMESVLEPAIEAASQQMKMPAKPASRKYRQPPAVIPKGFALKPMKFPPKKPPFSESSQSVEESVEEQQALERELEDINIEEEQRELQEELAAIQAEERAQQEAEQVPAVDTKHTAEHAEMVARSLETGETPGAGDTHSSEDEGELERQLLKEGMSIEGVDEPQMVAEEAALLAEQQEKERRAREEEEITRESEIIAQEEAALEAEQKAEEERAAAESAAATTPPKQEELNIDRKDTAEQQQTTLDSVAESSPETPQPTATKVSKKRARPEGAASPILPNLKKFKQLGKSLADLTGDKPLEASAAKMDKAEFEARLGQWEETVRQKQSSGDEMYKNVTCQRAEDVTTTTITFPNKPVQTIKHRYEKDCPKIEVTNPPDDQTIYLFIASSKSMAPLKMEQPCGDSLIALKLFEASIISGTSVLLHEADFAEIMVDKELKARFEKLKEIQKTPFLLDNLRGEASRNGYELGVTPIATGSKPSSLSPKNT